MQQGHKRGRFPAGVIPLFGIVFPDKVPEHRPEGLDGPFSAFEEEALEVQALVKEDRCVVYGFCGSPRHSGCPADHRRRRSIPRPGEPELFLHHRCWRGREPSHGAFYPARSQRPSGPGPPGGGLRAERYLGGGKEGLWHGPEAAEWPYPAPRDPALRHRLKHGGRSAAGGPGEIPLQER